MKKAIQVNINDKIYFIDEDAYTLLRNYLQQLAVTFPGAEGQEIVGDIENRVGELFDERITQGAHVIDIECVNQVIDTMGHPEDLDGGGDEEQSREFKLDGTPQGSTEGAADTEDTKKKLYRNPRNKVFGGVIGGLATYLGWDATIMRLLVVLVALCTAVMPCVICYLIAWMVIPLADTPRRQLEMMGMPVTVDSIGKNVKDATTPPPFVEAPASDGAFKDMLGTAVSVGAKVLMAFFGVIACLVGCGVTIALLFTLFFLVGFMLFGVAEMTTMMQVPMVPGLAAQCGWAVCVLLSILVVCAGICWAAGSVMFGWKSAGKAVVIVAVVLLLLLFAAASILLFYLNANGIVPVPFVD